jgi:hypothetical protein
LVNLRLNDRFIYLSVIQYNRAKGPGCACAQTMKRGGIPMPKAKVNQIEKKVAVSLPLQFKLEAKMLHLTPTAYYRWLKEKANYSTPYDQILANYKAQQQSQSPAKAQPEPKAQGSSEGEGEGDEAKVR